MIVTCGNCQTSFQLDDARVPIQGIRVRCSRCKQAFFLEHPSAGRARAIDEVAGEAALEGGRVAPGTTQDLPPSSALTSLAPREAASNETSGLDDAEEEGEWEFDRDPLSSAGSELSQGTDDDEAAPSASFGTMASGASSGLSLVGEDEQPADGPTDAPGPDREGASIEEDRQAVFGSVDDFSSLMEEDEAESSLEEESTTQCLPSAAETSATAGRYAEQGLSDDLGEPENWDFLSDDSLERGGFGDGPDGSLSAQEAREAVRASSDSPVAETDRMPGATAQGEIEPVSAYGPDASARPLARLGRGAGWLAVVSMLAWGLALGLGRDAATWVAPPATIALDAQWQAEGVRGGWIETARAGTLFVVSGELHNRGRAPVSPPGVIQVALLAADGRRLGVAPVAAGRVIPEQFLREHPTSELRPALDRSADALVRSSVEPGEHLAFQAVFADLPPEAARFALEAAARSPVETPTASEPASLAPSSAPASGAAQEHEPTSTFSDELTWGDAG